ncbi:response regulator [Streptomyces niveus]
MLVADDEALVRAAVRAILARDPGIEVVAEARDGQEAVDAVREHRPDVALLDIQMPGLDGIAAAERIHRELPGTAVVMLTTFGEDDFIARALRGGADGFLLKADDPRELLTGVHAVAGGGAYLSPKAAARVVAGLRAGGSDAAAVRPLTEPLAERLTEREHAVLALVGCGLSNAEIGRRLFLVEGTVEAHVSAILAKLGVRNRVGAAIAAYEAGLVGRGRDGGR